MKACTLTEPQRTIQKTKKACHKGIKKLRFLDDFGVFTAYYKLDCELAGTNTTRSKNIAIGHQADFASASLTNATAIGYGAIASTSNTIQLGNANVTKVNTIRAITTPGIGVGALNPNSSAAIEVSSTTQGFLPPRMTYAQRDAITSPAQGLIVYCTDCGTNGEPQFYNGTAWVNLIGGAALTGNYVTIGTQIWSNENLDVSTYRNGDPIPQVTDPTAWENLTTDAWCYYDNNSANGTKYGKLYNWFAVNDPRGLVPTRWHIPTETEWRTLINYLGGQSVAGGKLKASGNTYWDSPNTGTNLSGFSALPSGLQWEAGGFGGGVWISTMCSSTSLNASESRNFNIINTSDEIFPFDGPVGRGKAVRLIKD